MRILIAPDKFKGSLTAAEACRYIHAGIKKSGKAVTVLERPLADGGEGSVELLRSVKSLSPVPLLVRDPLGRPVRTQYFEKDGAAYIEMAAASGLGLLAADERSPMQTSSFGTGLMIRHALEAGAREVLLFIGGSATNDGGMGVAAALGYRFLDRTGKALEPIGKNLGKVMSIDRHNVSRHLALARIRVICDVENPFCGPEGAARMYAAQKGAGPSEVEALDEGLSAFAEAVNHEMGIDIRETKGAGAAGGLGGGAVAFLGAEIIPGIDFMMQAMGLEEAVRSVDLVITGEGKIDRQTMFGKVVAGVVRLAHKHRKPCIAFCGISELSEAEMEQLGLDEIISMAGGGISQKESLADPARILKLAAQRYFEQKYHD